MMKPVAGGNRRRALVGAETKGVALASWLLLATALAGCQARGYVRDPGAWTKGRDWSKAEPVRVAVAEYAFSPQILELQESTAYALEVVNTGSGPHEFSAVEFFRAVAVGRVVVRDVVSISGGGLEVIRLEPGGSVEVLFVAVRPGTYPITSDMPEDRRRAMGAAVRIAPGPQVR